MIGILRPVLVATFSAFVLAACAPRGESISVEQAYENAKTRFTEAERSSEAALTPEIKNKVIVLAQSLAKLGEASEAQQIQAESKIIATTLSELVPVAGYQNRPSFDELKKQHIQASQKSQYGGAADAAAKLLAMRTYHILSAELEGTKFKVAPLV